MWKKIAVGAVIGACTLGGGAAALAATDTGSSPTPIPSTSAQAKHPKVAVAAKLGLRRVEHAEWVSRQGQRNVTHDAIKGSVTAVSSTSIAVRSADGFSQTYIVNRATKVTARSNGKQAASGIDAVKAGDTVLVVGVKSGASPTANRIADAGTK